MGWEGENPITNLFSSSFPSSSFPFTSDAKNLFAIIGGAKGSLTKDELATAIRGLGLTPAVSDLPGGDAFSEDQFIATAGKFQVPDDTINGELTEAFRTFDRTNQGFLVEKEFMHMATILGEPFSAKEVASFKKHGEASGGKIEWHPLHKKITGQ